MTQISAKQMTLYTFGYLQGRASRIINELSIMKVPLVDVRFNPTSRNWRYTQEVLRNQPGVNYIHIPELGNELYKEALNRQFKEPNVRLSDSIEGMRKLRAILEFHGKAAIFCACASHVHCHRTMIAQLAIEDLNVKVVNL